MAESAGQLATKAPNRFPDTDNATRLTEALSNSRKTKMSHPAPTTTTDLTSKSIITSVTSTASADPRIMTDSDEVSKVSKLSSADDFQSFMKLMKKSHAELKNDQQRYYVDLKNQIDESSKKFEVSTSKLQSDLSNQVSADVGRWQETDVRLNVLEDKRTDYDSHIAEQSAINRSIMTRLSQLESRTEKLSLENPSRPLTNIDTSHILHSTTVSDPTRNVSITPPIANVGTLPSSVLQSSSQIYQPSNTTLFGSQERLIDAVSEFSGRATSVHPHKFISQLDVYFENVPLLPSQQLLSVQRRLTGDASTWFESLIPTPQSYTEFRCMFYQYFWSSVAQRKARNDVFQPFRYDRPTSLANHMMQWISRTKYLSPPIEQVDLVSIIIQHYPTPLEVAIRGRGPQNTNDLISILADFDESVSFCDNPRNDHGPRTPFPNNQPRRNNHEGNRFPPRPVPPTAPNAQPLDQLNVLGNGDAPRP